MRQFRPPLFPSTAWLYVAALVTAVGAVQTPARAQKAGDAAKSTAELLEQLHDADLFRGYAAADELATRGKAVVPQLVEKLDREEDFAAGALLCHTLGKLGDHQALPAMLRFIRRDLDFEEPRQGRLVEPPLAHGNSKLQHWYRHYVLPAVASLAKSAAGEAEENLDADVIATLGRLRRWHDASHESATSHEFIEPALGATRSPAAIPLLMESYVRSSGSGRARQAAAALVEIGRPVGAYLLADFAKLNPLEQRRRMEWLAVLADERRTRYVAEYARPQLRKEDVDRVLVLTSRDVDTILKLVDSDDRHVRFQLGRLLTRRQPQHPQEMRLEPALERLREDRDRSVQFGASGSDNPWRGNARGMVIPMPGGRRIRVAGRVPERFEAVSKQPQPGDVPLRVSVAKPRVRLDAPVYLENDPVWLKLERLDEKEGGEEDAVDLGEVTLVFWNHEGREFRSPLHHRTPRGFEPITEPYIERYTEWDHVQYASREDRATAYVDLIECTSFLAPGRWAVAAEWRRRLSPRVALDVADETGEAPTEAPTPMHFNPYLENPLATVEWRFYVGAAPQITLGNDALYFSLGRRLLALDKHSGRLRWSWTSEGGNLGNPRIDGGRLCVPRVTADKVDASKQSFTELAFDRKTGNLLDEHGIAAEDHVALRPISSENQRLRFERPAGAARAVVARDRETGREVWRRKDLRVGSLLAHGDLLLCTTPGYGPIHALDAATGTTRWTFADGSNQGRLPAIDGGVMYAGAWRGEMYAVGMRDGRLLWRMKPHEGGVHLQPFAEHGVVYFVAGDGYLYAVKNAGTAR